MKVSVFAKKKQTKEGKNFTAYIGKLEKKDGTTITASIRFREECGSPKVEECPCNIEFDKKDGNLVVSVYTDQETGLDRNSYTLWIQNWEMSKTPYEDHSLDEFE